MKQTALQTLQSRELIPQNSRILVCLSGGADSVALLHFLRAIAPKWQLELSALHLNHNLRGEESNADEAFTRALCREWHIPLTVETADIAALAKQQGAGVELAGRRARYAFFEREAQRQNALIATAHTRSDSAETLLLNLTRGAGLRGLCGIPAKRGNIIRPLIDCTRRQIEDYCAAHGLAYRTDSTNAADAYARNRVRHTLLPLLEQENPRFLERQAALSDLLRADADYLDSLADRHYAALRRPDAMALDRAPFLTLPLALQSRVLLRLLRDARAEVSARLVTGLLQLAKQGRGRQKIAPSLYFVCDDAALAVAKKPVLQPWFARQIAVDSLCAAAILPLFPGKSLKLTVYSAEEIKKTQIFQKKGYTDCLDCDRIDRIIVLRQRLPADSLRPVGRGHTKTLKNLFQEAGVPPPERLRRAVCQSAGRPVWLEGFGADQAAAASGASQRILTIEPVESVVVNEYF